VSPLRELQRQRDRGNEAIAARMLLMVGSMRPLVLVCLCVAGFATPVRAAQATAPTLDSLAPDARVLGFRAVALYADDDGAAIGARFIHERSDLTFDYLRMETAAQAFLWAETLPLSEKGESHTQEHLLITKGNKGRAVGTLGQMTLSGHSAFNAQRYTCFHFDTEAGPEALWPMLASVLEALLHPDYSDEEIHREVRNFGVADASGGQLRLEEKGAVYNEMVRTTEQPGDAAWYASRRLTFGATHPLARNQGGTPAGIRQLTADDIRRFHRDHYRLANMGLIGVFPRAVTLETVLGRVGALLDREPPRRDGKMASDADVPPATPAPAGTIDPFGGELRRDEGGDRDAGAAPRSRARVGAGLSAAVAAPGERCRRARRRRRHRS
jgi:hypothetical protein